MSPELPQVRPSVESLPMSDDVEVQSGGNEQYREREQIAERRVVTPGYMVTQAVAIASPAPVQGDSGAPSGHSTSADDDTPLVAADDDLIEKEWVDKVKRIIALTKDDPYERNRVIARLQADYLKKRHNRVIGQASG